MPRYLILYKINSAIQPVDPKVALEETEANLAAVEELQKAGIFKEVGTFNPGEGYLIAEFPSTEEAFKLAQRFWPGVLTDIREIIPWEKTKEIILSSLREQVK
jgi:uncharacterized protein YciI